MDDREKRPGRRFSNQVLPSIENNITFVQRRAFNAFCSMPITSWKLRKSTIYPSKDSRTSLATTVMTWII